MVSRARLVTLALRMTHECLSGDELSRGLVVVPVVRLRGRVWARLGAGVDVAGGRGLPGRCRSFGAGIHVRGTCQHITAERKHAAENDDAYYCNGDEKLWIGRIRRRIHA